MGEGVGVEDDRCGAVTCMVGGRGGAVTCVVGGVWLAAERASTAYGCSFSDHVEVISNVPGLGVVGRAGRGAGRAGG